VTHDDDWPLLTPGSGDVDVAVLDTAARDAEHRSGFLLAHLSDPHVPTSLSAWPWAMFNKRIFGYLHWRFLRARIHRIEVLDALRDDLIRIAPDHVAVTGDIVNISLPTEFTRTGLWLRSLGSPSDVTIVPGNHDAYVAVSWDRSWAAWRDFMAPDQAGLAAPPSPDRDWFPFVRRRGPVVIIGVSTAIPTAPGHASGEIGPGQLQRLASCLAAVCDLGVFRVVLLHHPPLADIGPIHKSLTDAADFQRVIAQQGAELILHGHEHRFRFNELRGPLGSVPVFGVPSASMLPSDSSIAAGQYHLHRIEQQTGGWLLETHMRTYRAELGHFVETERKQLILNRAVRSDTPARFSATTSS
jgi:3',5'-cyclic AMP phosphodiesterase CpdA